MNKQTKIKIPLLVAFLLFILGVATASATKLGDAYSWQGIQIGWILIVLGVVIGFGAWAFAKKVATAKKFALPVIALIGIGLLLAITDVSVVAPADITADVTWDVTCASSTDDITIDNDGRTITKLIWADATNEVINGTGDAVWTAAGDDPWLNFTISPSLAVGVSSTTNQATTRCSVLTPDQSFTEDSTSYDLFEDASTGGDKNLIWTTDGTTDYESKLCTVTIGGSETAALVINFLDDGLCIREAGESHSFQISVGGVTYTMTLIITALT